MPNALSRPGPQLVFAVAGALVFVGSLFFFVARYAWGMDGVPTGPAVPAVLFNVVLFTAFALHHSIFARSGIKGVVRRTWPPALERSLYVWIASLLFIVVCGLWQPVPGLWWDVQGSGRTVMQLGQLAAAIFVLLSARRLDVLDLSGVLQVLDVGGPAPTPKLYVKGAYRLVRHPIYLGWTLFVWLAPTMNGTRITFALVSCLYLVVAVPFEERDLAKTFGREYEEYSRRVRWRMLPLIYTFLFYISGHGFGHASRQVEIINALGALDASARILIRGAVNPDFLVRTLKVPYRLQSVECDSGIVQSTSVTHDDDATVRQAASFYGTFRDRIADEVDQVAPEGVKLIVGDIPPLAFEVAERLGVPSVAIGNFTWDWIYETQPGFGAIDGLLPLIRTAYAKATTALELPFGAGFEVFPAARRIPLVARHATQTRADTRAHFGVPPDRPAVLLSFGGYGLPSLDLSSIDCRDRWTIVTTDRITSKTGVTPSHVVFLAEETFLGGTFRYEDLVASSDAVITKPGYGIVAECIASNTPLLYTSRGVFREYDLFVREMPKYLRCRFISQADLFAGRWRESLESLLAQPAPPETIATNGAEVAARELKALVGRT